MDITWYELTLKGISEQALSRGHLLVELSLTRLFNSHWHNSSSVAGTIIQQSLARLFNGHWHYSSTVAGIILQQPQARFFLFFMLAEFFNSEDHCWRNVPCTGNTTRDPKHVFFFLKCCLQFNGDNFHV